MKRIYDPEEFVVKEILRVGESLRKVLIALDQMIHQDPQLTSIFRGFRNDILALGGMIERHRQWREEDETVAEIEWISKAGGRYIAGSVWFNMCDYGFTVRGDKSFSWCSYHPHQNYSGRTIINRDLLRHQRYGKARRLYGSAYINWMGIQTGYEIKRSM